MDIDYVIVCLSLVTFAGLVGLVVAQMFAAAERRRARYARDELLARAAGLAGAGPDFVRVLFRRKFAERVRAELPDALDMIANSLTAGLTLPQAILRNLDHFEPVVQSEFARVIYDSRLGFSIAGAFENFASRLGLDDAKMIAVASRIGVEHGGNLAESYRMLSALLREKISFEMELRSMTTEGRMQALVMSLLPFALLAILSLISWDLVGTLFTTMAGWGVLLGLCVMLAVAYVWIRKIVDIEV